MPALFIGRFQPFHLGHLQVLQKALLENEVVFVGIGSTQENFHSQNPFTVGERIQMIEAALQEAKISAEKFRIIPVPNINNYALWPKYVELSLPPFERIYTGSEVIKELFETYNQNLKNPYEIMFVSKELEISASAIRQNMLKNEGWENLLPKSVTELLNKWDAVKRIKNIQGA